MPAPPHLLHEKECEQLPRLWRNSPGNDRRLCRIIRAADMLARSGQIGPVLAEALKGEARRRVETRYFNGAITYTSLIARKP